jgi:hypothetical protein
MIPQHSLPGGRYPLPEPDFHRLDRASFAWRTRTDSEISLSILKHITSRPKKAAIRRLSLGGNTSKKLMKASCSRIISINFN